MQSVLRSGLASTVLASACFAAMAQATTPAPTPIAASQENLQRALAVGAQPSPDRTQVSYVREQALKDAALLLGARSGLADRSAELDRILNSRQAAFDAKYNFSELVIGNNVLPPVISESRDVVALEATVMRVAGRIFRIDEPARFALPTPTWRNWMWIGLDPSAVSIPRSGLATPENDAERALWDSLIKQAYEAGRMQAQAAFDANFASLERAYGGMRRYFDLWQRGMVSEPIIASSAQIVENEDPNTISVGTTIFRITAPAAFSPWQVWRPLE